MVATACLALLAGVYAPQLSSFSAFAGVIPLVLLLIVTSCISGRACAVLFFVGGSVLFVTEARQIVAGRVSSEYVGDSIMADVEVAGFPQVRGKTVSFIGTVRESRWVPRRIRVSWFDPASEVRLGDVWRLELRLKRPRGSSNPGIFDFEGWLFRQRIAATAYVVDSRRNVELQAAQPGPVNQYRQKAVKRLLAVLSDPDRASVLAALSVGARHLVSPGQWERYAGTGTTHLMAISGLHIGMAAMAAYLLVAVVLVPLGWSSHQHRAGAIAAFAAAFSYALVSGFAVPAQRAALMTGLVTVTVICARQARPFRIIAIASALLAGVDPLATMSPGFMLSFLAVLLLIWLARRRGQGSSGPSYLRPLRLAGQLLWIQMALLLGLMSVTIILFNRVALAAPIVNLVAVPVFSAVTVPCTLLGLLLDGPVGTAGDALLVLASRSLDFVELVIGVGLRMPAPTIALPVFNAWTIVLLAMPAAWVVLPAGWPGRYVACLAALAVITIEPVRPEPGCTEIVVIDVGQGLSILVLTHSSSLLYDTGPAFFNGGNAAETIVVPYLRGRGLRSIAHLVVSHADLDHSGGLATIVRQMDVGKIHVGESAHSAWLASPCAAGTAWTQDRIRFEFLHPDSDTAWSGNDASCVLQVSAGAHRMLLSGDIERPAEVALVNAGSLSPVDVVVVPHHGSRTSSTRMLVDKLQPQLAIVAAGFANRWGQPDPEVVKRWQDSGAVVLTTASQGAISFAMCERDGISRLQNHRDKHRRVWHE